MLMHLATELQPPLFVAHSLTSGLHDKRTSPGNIYKAKTKT